MVHISIYHRSLGNRYNPYEFQGDIQDRNIVADKTDITLAIAETCKRDSLTPKETNTLDRALKFAFTGAELQERHACLTDIYNALSKIDSVEARDIMEYLEMFVNGSFNIFAKQSNVNINDTRLLLFGLKDMGDKLRDLTMLIMLECVKERIMSNARKGKCTWLYIDEFHESAAHRVSADVPKEAMDACAIPWWNMYRTYAECG